MIKVFGYRNRIRKVAIVEDKAAMLPKAFVEIVCRIFYIHKVNR